MTLIFRILNSLALAAVEERINCVHWLVIYPKGVDVPSLWDKEPETIGPKHFRGTYRLAPVIGQGTWSKGSDDHASAIADQCRGLHHGMTHIDTGDVPVGRCRASFSKSLR